MYRHCLVWGHSLRISPRVRIMQVEPSAMDFGYTPSTEKMPLRGPVCPWPRRRPITPYGDGGRTVFGSKTCSSSNTKSDPVKSDNVWRQARALRRTGYTSMTVRRHSSRFHQDLIPSLWRRTSMITFLSCRRRERCSDLARVRSTSGIGSSRPLSMRSSRMMSPR